MEGKRTPTRAVQEDFGKRLKRRARREALATVGSTVGSTVSSIACSQESDESIDCARKKSIACALLL